VKWVAYAIAAVAIVGSLVVPLIAWARRRSAA
jgi:hypothetical protein